MGEDELQKYQKIFDRAIESVKKIYRYTCIQGIDSRDSRTSSGTPDL